MLVERAIPVWLGTKCNTWQSASPDNGHTRCTATYFASSDSKRCVRYIHCTTSRIEYCHGTGAVTTSCGTVTATSTVARSGTAVQTMTMTYACKLPAWVSALSNPAGLANPAFQAADVVPAEDCQQLPGMRFKPELKQASHHYLTANPSFRVQRCCIVMFAY